jgi:hypothetical protein
MWWGTVVLLAQILGIVLVAPRHSSDPMRVMLAAVIGAAGTLVMAVVLAPLSRVPRAAYWITAGLYAAFILVSPALSPTPQSWIEFMRSQLWYLPWFFLIVVSESPRPRATGLCESFTYRSGVLLVGVALLFLGIVTFAMRIPAGHH